MASDRKERRDIAQEVTDRIVERIEESGGELPWRKPWRSRAIAHPCRHEGIGYRGINHLILSLEAFARGFTSPYWMTFRQSREYGGSVIKGEKGTRVVFYGVADKRDGGGENGGSSGANARRGKEGGDVDASYRFLKSFVVFNASQIEDLPERFHPVEDDLDTGARPIPELEAFFTKLPVPVVTGDERACYREITDDILMPDIARFEEPERFYSTLAHERKVDVREVLQGVLYILETGCQWRHLPKDFPPRSTVWDYFDLWSYDGTLDRIHDALYVAMREAGGCEASPTAAIIDSRTAKSAEKGGANRRKSAMTRARRPKASSGTCSSIRSA